MESDLLAPYLAGADDLRRAVDGMTAAELAARPIIGQWSTQEVVCHLADSETLFAERMKRILAEERPPLLFADPQLFVPALAYDRRDVVVELGLIELTRQQMATILRAAPQTALARCGVHSTEGERTLKQVLQKAIAHLQHHLKFIHEKRRALAADSA